MSVSRKRWLLWIVALFMMTPCALAYEEVEDLVDILATDSAFIAVVDGKRNFSKAKGPDETILWQGAKGEIGAFSPMIGCWPFRSDQGSGKLLLESH